MADLRSRVDAASATARKMLDRVNERRELRTGQVLLELDLTDALAQGSASEMPTALLQRRHVRLTDVLRGLARASRDPRVAALVVKVGSAGWGYARTQELRDAVLAFRAAGKPAVAWAETFGEWGPGTAPYYLATAFEEIWLHPVGDVTLTGVTMSSTFVRGALDKLEVEPQFGRRYEYKNAVDMFEATAFSGPHREAVERVARSVFETVVDGIAGARGLSADRVRELVDAAPLSADDALSTRLVDHLGYRDEVYAEMTRRHGDARLQYFGRYLHAGTGTGTAPAPNPPTLALIWGVGPIAQGHRGRRAPAGPVMMSDTVTAAFRAAVRQEDVRAIVFRVDSPGGSAIASDVIWREVVRARAAGKPVVVSMGDVAGSGGYYVSMAADAIVAEPSTITGSIGVLSGKLMTDRMWNRLGVTTDSVSFGAGARMFNPRESFTQDERAALEKWLDRVYEAFVRKVADGRGMTWDAVHAVAKGRIWTGSDARDRGLVDELGGLDRAIAIAKRKADIGAAQKVSLVEFPKVRVGDLLVPPSSSEHATGSAATGLSSLPALPRLPGLLGPTAAAVVGDILGLGGTGPLMMPWVPEIG